MHVKHLSVQLTQLETQVHDPISKAIHGEKSIINKNEPDIIISME